MLLHRFGDTSCLVFIDHCATQLHPRSLLYMFMHYNRTVPSPLYGFRVSYFVASAADGFSFLSKVSPALILTLLIITTKHISPINRWDILDEIERSQTIEEAIESSNASLKRTNVAMPRHSSTNASYTMLLSPLTALATTIFLQTSWTSGFGSSVSSISFKRK